MLQTILYLLVFDLKHAFVSFPGILIKLILWLCHSQLVGVITANHQDENHLSNTTADTQDVPLLDHLQDCLQMMV
jgi:hypothetical protein